jgi:hypothetical protein
LFDREIKALSHLFENLSEKENAKVPKHHEGNKRYPRTCGQAMEIPDALKDERLE